MEFNDKVEELQLATKIELPALYLNLLNKINHLELYEMKNSSISFYACDFLLERNKTYEVQIYEPDYLMIGQDVDLAYFIKSDEENIYSNDLGALGSVKMTIEASDIETFLKHCEVN